MPRSSSAPLSASPWLDRDLLPALGAAAVSALLLSLAAAGGLGWGTALLLAAVAWAGSAAWLAMRLRQRDLSLRVERERLESLEELQARHGLAESLGAFGTWLIDRAHNRLVWSPGAFRLFGVDPALGEPSLRAFSDGIHPEDRQRWIEAHRKALRKGGEVRIEYRYLIDGRERWVRSIATAERNAQGSIDRVGGVAQDITGIRAMQQQLAASESKFRDLTSLSSDWIWETDAGHRWSAFSDSADTVLGDWVRGLLGSEMWDLPASQFAFEQPDWQAQRARMLAQAPFENFEYAVVDAFGGVHFLSISGRAVYDTAGRFAGYRGIGRDITREKQQRLLLKVESDIASIMREQTEPERVVTAIIITLCGVLGWSGGVSLVRVRDRALFVARERWGYPEFTAMISELPTELPMLPDGAETHAWQEGRARWIPDLAAEPQLARRYQAERLGARAAFLAPILDESGNALSLLLFLSPASYQADQFLSQVAEILSRNLSLYLQRKAAENRLMHQSLHDALTDLPNRVYLTHQLETRLARAEPSAVLYIDLDRYKIINDTLGHSVGDQVLIEVATRLRESIRPQDVAGRIGGDEFILLLTGLSDRAEIERIARRVLAAIEKPFVLMNRAYFLSASIGVAIAPDDGTDAKLLVKCADSAMYRVKSEGRNDVRFFTGGMSDERTEQLQLAAELPLAMQRGDVDLHYQPILDVAERRVAGFEALLRWRHPTRGLLMPDRFLPIAEQSNLIREVGLWAIRRALDDRVALGLDRYDDAAVSVNVSARQLAEEGFLASLNAMLAERAFPPRLLRLELTESAFIEHPERTAALIAELRRLGVRVIIDNFGTGYASLAYLKNLPVDGLKIDQAFVRDLPADRGNAAIVQAITTLAAKLGLQAMAEGVETAAELKALRSFECEQMQGTLISEPLPFPMLQDFMESLPEVRRMHLVRDVPAP
ncbi:MAG TPA: EAL domain-containing protein [Quisquiliibacterium sp.]|nr:EAL domain-containing protein [Quisquiliibacterium sp.]HQN12470.1 EAL domain-containing protein [Quisquiliibacterium sp.]